MRAFEKYWAVSLVCVALLSAISFGMPASAETVRFSYAPSVGQHSVVRLTKCVDTQPAQQPPSHQCVTFTYDEQVISGSAHGFRIRYLATHVDGPGGEQALALLQQMPLDLDTDEAGYPIKVENRQQLMDRLPQTIPGGDPTTVEATIHMFQQMGDAAVARAFAKDFLPLSMFQNLTAEVGEVRTQQVQTPFPLAPSLILTGSTSSAVLSVDHNAGIANARSETRYDPDSLARAAQALKASILAQRHETATDDTASLQFSTRVDAVIDLATGSTRHARSVRFTVIDAGVDFVQQVETIELNRTITQR